MNQKIIAVIAAGSMLFGGAGVYAGMNLLEAEKPEAAAVAATAQADSDRAAAMDKIEKAYDLISNEYVEKVDREKLLEGAIQGMLSTLNDPYSVYMDKQTAKQFSDSLDSSFEGIGAEVGVEEGKIIIVSPFKQSPAEKAGLKPNDEIISIDGESMAGKDLNDAVLKIRGKKGSSVSIKIQRPGTKKQLSFRIKRAEIPLETVFASEKKCRGILSGISPFLLFLSILRRILQKRWASSRKKELKASCWMFEETRADIFKVLKRFLSISLQRISLTFRLLNAMEIENVIFQH